MSSGIAGTCFVVETDRVCGAPAVDITEVHTRPNGDIYLSS